MDEYGTADIGRQASADVYCDSRCIGRDDPRVGEVCVHFPQVGFHVAPA